VGISPLLSEEVNDRCLRPAEVSTTQFVRLSEVDVVGCAIVFFHPDLSRLTTLSIVDLITRTEHS